MTAELGVSSSRLLHSCLQARAAGSRRHEVIVSFVDRPAGECRDQTAGELWDAAVAFGAALRAHGITTGARIALMLSNEVEFLIIVFGASMCGVTIVPLNTELRGPLLKYVLRQAAPVAVFADTAFLGNLSSALDADSGPDIVVVGNDDDAAANLPANATSFSRFLVTEPGAFVPVLVEPQQPAMILYTSGTTGPSKGVVCSHEMMVSWGEQANEVLGYTGTDVSYSCLPLFHVNALCCSVLPAWSAGGRAVLAPRFSASRFWNEIRMTAATVTSVLGSMGPVLLAAEPAPADTAHALRLVLAVPFDERQHEAFRARFRTRTTALYGLTDSAIPLGIPYDEDRPGSCGRPTKDWECAVVNERDEPVGDNQPGQLVLRPRRPFVGMSGYLDQPEATLAAWRNLWFHTRDEVVRDTDGWFYFLGRMSDSIRRSGESISAFEVESVVLELPEVAECAAYGVEAPVVGQEVMVAVLLNENLDVMSIAQHCVGRLPYYAVPRYYRVVSDFERTSTEKIVKAGLRAEGVTADTRDVGDRRARTL